MLVLFNVNLGSMDAAKIGVDFKRCTLGTKLEVEANAGKWLVGNGIATDVSPTVPLGVKVEAIPEPPNPEPIKPDNPVETVESAATLQAVPPKKNGNK